MVKKNKKGWIKIVEALVSILMLIGIVLTVIGYQSGGEKTSMIEDKEVEILNNIQINQTLRQEILLESPLPVDSTQAGFPTQLGEYINESIPSSLNCTLKICASNSDCLYENNFEKDVFAKEILITANKDIYNPRILKIFCYLK